MPANVPSTKLKPRFMRLKDALFYAGRSRSSLYREAARRPGLFRKAGTSTLVDVDKLDRWLDELPAAKFQQRAA